MSQNDDELRIIGRNKYLEKVKNAYRDEVMALRKLLAMILPGAMWESCHFRNDPRANPTFCCDWNEVVDAILEHPVGLWEEVSMDIHKNYNTLSQEEKDWVDSLMEDLLADARVDLGFNLANDDRAERVVEAISTWIVESRESGKCPVNAKGAEDPTK